LRLARALLPNASFSILCFGSRLPEFETQFDANPFLLHISHFSRSVRSQNSTNTASQKCREKTHTSSQQKASWQNDLQGQGSGYLVTHNCTTSGFRAAFRFREHLGSTSYVCHCLRALRPYVHVRSVIIHKSCANLIHVISHHGMPGPNAADGETTPICGVAVNILNKQSRAANKGWSSSFGLGEGLTTPHLKNVSLLRNIHKVSNMN
jgi:hypothetical protein